jgi:Ca2+-binding EF-hand superfamily protein
VLTHSLTHSHTLTHTHTHTHTHIHTHTHGLWCVMSAEQDNYSAAMISGASARLSHGATVIDSESNTESESHTTAAAGGTSAPESGLSAASAASSSTSLTHVKPSEMDADARLGKSRSYQRFLNRQSRVGKAAGMALRSNLRAARRSSFTQNLIGDGGNGDDDEARRLRLKKLYAARRNGWRLQSSSFFEPNKSSDSLSGLLSGRSIGTGVDMRSVQKSLDDLRAERMQLENELGMQNSARRASTEHNATEDATAPSNLPLTIAIDPSANRDGTHEMDRAVSPTPLFDIQDMKQPQSGELHHPQHAEEPGATAPNSDASLIVRTDAASTAQHQQLEDINDDTNLAEFGMPTMMEDVPDASELVDMADEDDDDNGSLFDPDFETENRAVISDELIRYHEQQQFSANSSQQSSPGRPPKRGRDRRRTMSNMVIPEEAKNAAWRAQDAESERRRGPPTLQRSKSMMAHPSNEKRRPMTARDGGSGKGRGISRSKSMLPRKKKPKTARSRGPPQNAARRARSRNNSSMVAGPAPTKRPQTARNARRTSGNKGDNNMIRRSSMYRVHRRRSSLVSDMPLDPTILKYMKALFREMDANQQGYLSGRNVEILLQRTLAYTPSKSEMDQWNYWIRNPQTIPKLRRVRVKGEWKRMGQRKQFSHKAFVSLVSETVLEEVRDLAREETITMADLRQLLYVSLPIPVHLTRHTIAVLSREKKHAREEYNRFNFDDVVDSALYLMSVPNLKFEPEEAIANAANLQLSESQENNLIEEDSDDDGTDYVPPGMAASEPQHHLLAERPDTQRMDRATFVEYFQLPGHLGDKLFNMLDAKRTGYINYDEFVEGLAHYSTQSPHEKLEMLFRLYDINGDNALSRVELTTMVASMLALQTEAAELDGTLSAADAKTDSWKVRAHVRELVDQAFDTCDVNSNGKLEMSEFQKWTENQPAVLNVSLNQLCLCVYIVCVLCENIVFETDGTTAVGSKPAAVVIVFGSSGSTKLVKPLWYM